jgi:hypothetical protein
MNDELKLHEKNRIDLNLNKFLQRITIEQKYEHQLCDWIIQNFEIYNNSNIKWVENAYFIENNQNLDNIFFLEKIDIVFPTILDSFSSIVDDIIKCYNLDPTYMYKITEIFIEKYEEQFEQLDEIYYKNCDIVINILLNKNTNINNQFINFSDGIITNAKKGDMMIFSSKTRHYKIKTNNDQMYILVGLLKIYTK